jgi:hypothetical protein
VHAELGAHQPGEPTRVLRRRRNRPLRRRRLRRKDPQSLNRILDDTETWLGAIAAEARQAPG